MFFLGTFSVHLLKIIICKFIYLNAVILREAETELFHVLSHSPDGCVGHDWGRLRPGARSFVWISPVSTGASFTAASGALALCCMGAVDSAAGID